MAYYIPMHYAEILKDVKMVILKAENINTAAGLESMYLYGYLHGSPSRFSAKSATYTAAGCQQDRDT